MKILKKKNKIIIEIDFWTKRSNPYNLDEDVGNHQTLIGIIRNDDHGNEELGFAQVIDMDYKGKGDQETDIIIYTDHLKKDDFIKLCKEIGLNYIEYPICNYCKRTIYGCFTIGNKGNMCNDCEDENKK